MLKKYHKKYIPHNMLYGTLIKITNTRKLMIKIEEGTYKFLSARLTSYAALKKTVMERPATFSLTNDDGEKTYFVMISLDKYDKGLLDTKFEPLLKKKISITYKFKTYSFTPEGADKPCSGINVGWFPFAASRLRPSSLMLRCLSFTPLLIRQHRMRSIPVL